MRNGKLKSIEKANIVAEQNFLKNKGIINEDYSDGDERAAEMEGYYTSIVGDDPEKFLAHYNTPNDLLSVVVSKLQESDSYYKPEIMASVILQLLQKI